MTIWVVILVGWLTVAVIMLALWVVQRATRNAGIVDVAWSFGTGLLGAWFAWSATGDPIRRALVGALAAIWGVRLGIYLLRRVTSEEEDGRYRMLRERWGHRTQLYLFWFFQIQATWAVLFALPMLVAAMNPAPALAWHDWVGLAVWIVALSGEGIADAQLARFRADSTNHGHVCDRGLWRFSRHPNYFFEWMHWFAYVFLAIGWSWGWLTLLGPAVMLVFLLKITGIPLTEARAVRSRGEAYRVYQRSTNAFFPGPRKIVSESLT